MSRIITNVPHLHSISIWRKLYILSHRGDGSKLVQKTRDDLSGVNIPADYWVILHLFKNWHEYDIPIPVGMFLWLFRERQSKDGSFSRWPHSSVAETGPAFRYVELALLVGETCESDRHLRKAIDWLFSIRFPHGGMPTHIDDSHYDPGTTGQTLQALSLADPCGKTEEIDEIFAMLFKTAKHVNDNLAAWGLESGDGQFSPSTAKTALIVTAALFRKSDSEIIVKATNWLISRQRVDGSWTEYDQGKPSVDTTFNVFQAIHHANEKNLLSPATYIKVKEKLINWLDTLKPDFILTLGIPQKSFLLRLYTIAKGPRNNKTIDHLARLRIDCIESMNADVDIYGHTAILGIAIMEWIANFKAILKEKKLWNRSRSPEFRKIKWLWNLEPMLPLFLRREVELTDLLYTNVFSYRFIRIIDTLTSLNLGEVLIGVSIGIFVALSVLNDSVIGILSIRSPIWVSIFLNVIIIFIHMIWLLAKLSLSGTRIRRFVLYVFSLICTTILIYFYQMVKPLPDLLSFVRLVAVYGLIVDIISHTTDRSGFVRYLLGTR